MPVPLPPKKGLAALADKVEEDYDEKSMSAPITLIDCTYNPEKSLKFFLFFRKHLNVFIRDLVLPKQMAELASRLKENNLLQKDVVVTHYRKGNIDLSTIFESE